MRRSAPRAWWRRRPKIGARVSIALHLSVMLLCAIAIHADAAPTLAWILFGLNAVGAALVVVAVGIGELPEDRKPFGPFTDVAEFLGFLDERTPQGRFVAWLRQRGFLE
jgi:hypothetical protein